jgi:hypothetical protein
MPFQPTSSLGHLGTLTFRSGLQVVLAKPTLPTLRHIEHAGLFRRAF